MKAHHEALMAVARRCSVAALLFVVAAVPVEGQSEVGSWLAFTGCWTPLEQDAEERPTLCVVPGEDRFSAEFVTVRDGEVVSREVARADARPVDASQEGCEGTTTWRFSQDGHRVYHRSEHVCDGTVNRKGSGMMVMLNPTEWMDVSAVEVEGEVTPWVQRYRMAGIMATQAAGYAGLGDDQEMAIRAARMYSTTSPTIAAIIEAGQTLHAETVQAWLVESEPDLNVNAEQLIRIADAGVDSEVIDVVVAVANPQRFQLREEDRRGVALARQDRDRDRYRRRVGTAPWYYSPFGFGYYDGYGSYGYGYSPYRYGYNPYSYGRGYGMGYGYGGYYGIGYRPVVVQVSERPAEQRGRLVRGLGYVRGGDRGRSTAVGSDGGGTWSSGGSRSGGSSVGASSGGYRGGSGSSTGRTARRRGGSGG
ncbi:MAG: hypothetical protein OXE73_08320 [Gammaproteobacteria bacterium]|nr:hypothetical protein [Gammaproteobacteria bacterium]